MRHPWSEWIPGALNDYQIEQLYNEEAIVGRGAFDRKYVDKSSVDLWLSDEGYHMTQKYSVKPSGRDSYTRLIQREGSAERLPKQADGTYILKSRNTYVFKLQEKLGRKLLEAKIHGQATAKSSVGRIDVLARLVVDGMDQYEGFDPERVNESNFFGEMCIEITPMTFDVRVKEGISLSQLRFFYGHPDKAEIGSKEIYKTVLGQQAAGRSLGVDLTPVTIRDLEAVAFCARKENEPAPWGETTS